MLVHDVFQFIEGINSVSKKHLFEMLLLQEISDYFSLQELSQELKSQDIDFLKRCFAKRWQHIIGTKLDYTIDPSGINVPYIELAKKMDAQNYLFVLIPMCSNKKDPHDMSELTETKNLENFFLGNTGTVAYRKKSFCNYLSASDHQLSIKRHNHSKRSPMSVLELERLKRCQVNHEFSENDEKFSSVWDYLYRQSFPKLQTLGCPPVALYSELRTLLDQYFINKKTEKDFVAFRKLLEQFFERMLSFDLNDVNYFYGEKVHWNNKSYYLLECFIKIHQSKTYEHDDLIKALIAWLSGKSPILRSQTYEPSRHSNSAMSLLLYFFCHSFTCKKSEIIFWDKRNSVPRDVDKLVDKLITVVADNKSLGQKRFYKDIVKEIFEPWINQYEINRSSDWLSPIQDNLLWNVGMLWFEPELLMHALSSFKCAETNEQKLKCYFLDELLHIYALSVPELYKRLRVNIQFHKFSNSLSKETKQQLLLWLCLNMDLVPCTPELFLKDSARYIVSQLSILTEGEVKYSSNLFKRRRDQKLLMEHGELQTVADLIREFIINLKLNHEGSPSKYKYEDAIKYLNSLLTPILTVKEKEEANSIGDIYIYNNGSNW